MLVGSTDICIQRDRWTRGEARHPTRRGLNLGNAENSETVSVVSKIHTWQSNSFTSKVRISYILNFGWQKTNALCKLLHAIRAESDFHSICGVWSVSWLRWVSSKLIFTPPPIQEQVISNFNKLKHRVRKWLFDFYKKKRLKSLHIPVNLSCTSCKWMML